MENIANSTNKGEQESVNETEQRREARRRKILDNAAARLEKLGGRINHHEDRKNTFFEYPDPEVEPNEINFNFNHKPIYTTPPNSTSTETAFDPFADDEPPKEYITFKYRLHVLLSVAITYILTLMGTFGDSTYFSVFIPTGICVALELILKPARQMNPLIAFAITLGNMSPHYANMAWTVLSIAYDLAVDFGLSVFTIVSLTLIYNYFSGNTIATLQ